MVPEPDGTEGSSTEPGDSTLRRSRRLEAEVGATGPASQPPGGAGKTELRPGEVVGGHYSVKKRIGGGAFGAVYAVEHLGLGKKLAVKVVAASRATDRNSVARLRAEARTLAAIDHENIVSVTDLGQTDDGRLFVVMELLEGETLGRRLDRQHATAANKMGQPWLPDDEVRRIVPQILSALSAAHRADVIHRDLKPDNIILARKRGGTVVKIVDFGISKVRGPSEDAKLTATGQLLGTPLYMAPEQGRSTADVDLRADLYSFGCILYELMTGDLPHRAETIYDCVVKHATATPTPPSQVRADLPASVETLILRCIQKQPGQRFESADELLAAWRSAWGEAAPPPDPELAETLDAPAATASPERASGPAATPTPELASGPAAAGPVGSVQSPGASAGTAPARPRRGLILAVGGLVAVGAAVVLIASGALQGAPREPAEPVRAEQPAPPVPPPPSPAEETEPVAPSAVQGAVEVEDPAPPQEEPTVIVRQLRSQPDGAEVFIDGRHIGTTPMPVEVPRDGEVTVEVRRRGRRSVETTVSADGPEEVLVRLPPAAAPRLAPQ